jgi:acyl carrier protein phosphodiesterase
MNFLAHAYFANGDAHRIVGQFCGDFVRGSDLSAYSSGIQRGIRMHRQIDAFTDRHPAVLGVRPLFKPPLRRLAGVITDVVYDHCLALNWSDYSQEDLGTYISNVNAALLEHKAIVPTRMQGFIDFIVKNQVLQANQDFAGVEVTLQRLSKRSKVFAALENSPSVAEKNMIALQQSFDEFFPQLCRYVDELNQSGTGA